MTTPAGVPKPPARLVREWNELRLQIGLWHVVGGALMLISAGFTLYLAFKGNPTPEPAPAESGAPPPSDSSGSDSVTIAILAILAQAGSAAIFAYSRRFDPRYAQSALAHLTTLIRRASKAVEETQRTIEETDPNPAVVLERLRVANVEFSYIQESAVDAADDWYRVLDAPLRRNDADAQPAQLTATEPDRADQ